MSDSGNGEGEDYIYRGDPSTPQDGQPWNPPTPPPTGPPAAVPYPSSPPPGFPPQQPPVGPPMSGIPAPAEKKKRWPWVVAAVVLQCGLPLGGCVALIGIGVNEINERSDAIEQTVADFMSAVEDGNLDKAESLTDGQSPCMTPAVAVQAILDVGSGQVWTNRSTAFVDRTSNSSLSSNADPETFIITGRPDESAGLVLGELSGGDEFRDVEVLLSKPLSSWRICTITVR